MARKEIIVDDLDDTELKDGDGGGAVLFSIRGVEYTIDLNKKNQDKLDKVLEPYIAKATKVVTTPVRSGVASKKVTKVSSGGDKDQRAAIRDWANANGYTVSDRGRIKQEIVDAYEAAH